MRGGPCAVQVFGYCMFKDGAQAKIGYPTEGYSGEVAGRSFHNGALPLGCCALTLAECSVACFHNFAPAGG